MLLCKAVAPDTLLPDRHDVVPLTLGFLGITSLSKGTPPVPKQAIEEAKLTTGALKGGS